MNLISQSWPNIIIADAQGNPVPDVSGSTAERYALEKILELPAGEYRILRPDATVVTEVHSDGSGDVVTDPDPEPEPTPEPEPDPEPTPEPDEPAPDQGDGGPIVTDEAKLHDYPDPTTLDHYVEYPPDPVVEKALDKPLAEIAAEMQPGEWRGLGRSEQLVHAAWADKAMWDPERQRFSYVGHHWPGGDRPTRWSMWDVKNGQWHKQTGNQFHPYAGIDNQWGYRSYGKYTQLADGSNVYARHHRLWKQDPETLEWSAWKLHPRYKIIGNIEFFPERNSIVSFMARYSGLHETLFFEYRLDTDDWMKLPLPYVQGRHSLMRYNATRGEMFLLGGDDTFRKAQILQADGALRQVADIPRNARIRADLLTYDPISGHYLVVTQENDEELGLGTGIVHFYGLDPDAGDNGEWYLIAEWEKAASWTSDNPWPFSEKAMPVVTAIPEMGVTMWDDTTRSGIRLYKHKVQ